MTKSIPARRKSERRQDGWINTCSAGPRVNQTTNVHDRRNGLGGCRECGSPWFTHTDNNSEKWTSVLRVQAQREVRQWLGRHGNAARIKQSRDELHLCSRLYLLHEERRESKFLVPCLYCILVTGEKVLNRFALNQNVLALVRFQFRKTLIVRLCLFFKCHMDHRWKTPY